MIYSRPRSSTFIHLPEGLLSKMSICQYCIWLFSSYHSSQSSCANAAASVTLTPVIQGKIVSLSSRNAGKPCNPSLCENGYWRQLVGWECIWRLELALTASVLIIRKTTFCVNMEKLRRWWYIPCSIIHIYPSNRRIVVHSAIPLPDYKFYPQNSSTVYHPKALYWI